MSRGSGEEQTGQGEEVMKKVTVAATLIVEVMLEDDDNEVFIIEDNGCPGTGIVSIAIDKLMEKYANSNVCEMCNAGCENKILKVEKV